MAQNVANHACAWRFSVRACRPDRYRPWFRKPTAAAQVSRLFLMTP